MISTQFVQQRHRAPALGGPAPTPAALFSVQCMGLRDKDLVAKLRSRKERGTQVGSSMDYGRFAVKNGSVSHMLYGQGLLYLYQKRVCIRQIVFTYAEISSGPICVNANLLLLI